MLRSTYERLNREYEKGAKELKERISREIGENYSSGGHWHDNPGYDAALERQTRRASRLIVIGKLLEHPIFIDELPIDGKTIRIGTQVELEDDKGEKLSYKILGTADMRYYKDAMSCYSPLARQLIGRQEGDAVTCDFPEGRKTFSILKIRKWEGE